jgi:penicillin V acylase-like amidase (Ntn superfamily)
VGWRSFSRRILLVVAVASAAAGCGRFVVRPSEKEHLADRTMKFDQDLQEAAADDHVMSNREGAAGGRGTAGGGCGCN